MSSVSGSEYIYFTGDLFVSEGDDVELGSMIEDAFGHNPAVINLEGVPDYFGEGGRKAVSLSLNPAIASTCSSTNCYFSLVNNHTSDNGRRAFEELKKNVGVKALVSQTNEPDPRKQVGPLQIVFFADEREECRCAKFDFLRFDRSVIEEYSEFIRDSLVIVHGGIEYRKHPTPYQRDLSMLLIDLGARGVLFHHSHVQGEHEWYREKLIHYGLGNFYFSEVSGLHGLSSIDGCVLRFCTETGEFATADVVYETGDASGKAALSLDFRTVDKSSSFPAASHYRNWYRSKYALDASLRPRQLSKSEWFVRGQFHLWYLMASSISKLGFAAKLKGVFGRFVRQ